MTSIMPPQHSLSPTRIMASPQAISILCQMELHMFMSPTYGFLAGAILAKGCRLDFNNGLRGKSNSGPILSPRRLFESDSNNGLSPGHLNLVSDGLHLFMSPTYGFLAGAILAKGCRPDFNNGRRGDSNSSPILLPAFIRV